MNEHNCCPTELKFIDEQDEDVSVELAIAFWMSEAPLCNCSVCRKSRAVQAPV